MNKLLSKYLVLILFILPFVNIAFSQEFDRKKKEKMWRNKEELAALGLNRFFWEGTAFMYTNNSDANIGTAYRVGHNCFFIQKRFTGLLRVTWAQTGLGIFGGLFNPLHVGVGPIIRLGKTSNLEATFNGGVVCATDDAIYPQLEFFPHIYWDLKLNLKKTSISVNYGPWRVRDEELVFNTSLPSICVGVGMRF